MVVHKDNDVQRVVGCLNDHIKMISGKPMTFDQRKSLVHKYLIGGFLDKFLLKVADTQSHSDMLSFAIRLSDFHLLSSPQISEIARKRVRYLDDNMTDKIRSERDFGVIEEFLRLSIICGKEERMKKVVQNFIISKLNELDAKDAI